MIVVQVEVAYEDEDAGEIRETMERVLEEARGSAAARIVGSYSQPGKFGDKANEGWRNKAIDYVEIPVASRVRVD